MMKSRSSLNLRHRESLERTRLLPETGEIQRVMGVACLILFFYVTGACANQYTISIATGYNLIANELDHTNDLGQLDGNNLSLIMADANTVGCWLFKYDNVSGQFYTAYHGPVGWTADLTLNPGEGAWLANPNPPFQLTFTGIPHAAVPVQSPSGLYSCQDETLASPRSYTDITDGMAPARGTYVYSWTGSGYATHDYMGTAWVGGAPAVAQGSAVWINIIGNPPLTLAMSSNWQQNGGSLTLVWLDAILQQSTDLLTWNDVTNGPGSYVSSPYTVATGEGSLFYRLRSP
jgi:hypothetical protein